MNDTTTTYDFELKSRLKHLELHSAYLPHIGSRYNEARAKTFIIAESHYIPKVHNNKFSAQDWYTNPTSIYQVLDDKSKSHKTWFNTRGIVRHYQTYSKQEKGHGIFKNLETAYHEINAEVKLFDECVFFNYFQRPSEVEGESINVQEIDSQIALENILVLSGVLKPDKIIFVSSKAYNNFIKHVSKVEKEKLPYIGSVPHPSASSWWNRKSKKYGLNGKAVTGKEKFQRIMTPKIQ